MELDIKKHVKNAASWVARMEEEEVDPQIAVRYFDRRRKYLSAKARALGHVARQGTKGEYAGLIQADKDNNLYEARRELSRHESAGPVAKRRRLVLFNGAFEVNLRGESLTKRQSIGIRLEDVSKSG